MNHIWFVMILAGLIVTVCPPGHEAGDVTSVIVVSSAEAVKFAISLASILAFWSGIMQIAQEAGLTRRMARILAPLSHRLFPEIPKDHPAMGAMLLSFAANILGLGNAATPLGIQAMRQLQSLNNTPDRASDAMCTYIALCASGLTLVPTTVIALRGVTGSKDPTSIVAGTIWATAWATIGALIADRCFRTPPRLLGRMGKRRV
ncbi:MAG: nucleoside recognition domain-containing protein [Limnochordia bacterium]|jgi:spore maturation protein A